MADVSKTEILLVEDSHDIRLLIRRYLTKRGFQIIEAANGQIALDYLKASVNLPSLILLDLMMPVMDGFQFRTEQLAIERFASIPLICMTADAKISEKIDVLQVPECLKKPLEPSDLLARIQSKLS